MEFTNNVKDYYWNVDDLIGKGKYSKVYIAYDMSSKVSANRECAIKIIPSIFINSNSQL